MLFDPRANLNITTGVLPVKAINIPSKLYYDALRRIEVTFLNAPIITPRGHIRLPIMEDNDFNWEWKYYDDGGHPDKKYITKDWFTQGLQAIVTDIQMSIINSIWSQLQEKNVIKPDLNNNNKTYYNKSASLDNIDFKGHQPDVLFILNNYSDKELKVLTQDMVIMESQIIKGLEELKLSSEPHFTYQKVKNKMIDSEWIEQITEHFVVNKITKNITKWVNAKYPVDTMPAVVTDFYAILANSGITVKQIQENQLNNLLTILKRYAPNWLGTLVSSDELIKDYKVFGFGVFELNNEAIWKMLLKHGWLIVKKNKFKLANNQGHFKTVKDYIAKQKETISNPTAGELAKWQTTQEKWISEQDSFKWILETYAVGIEPELQFPDYQLQEIREGWLEILPTGGW